MRSTGRPHGSTLRGHHPPSPSLGVRLYSSNLSREERLGPCPHPPYDGGYLRGQLVPFRTIKRYRGTRRALVLYVITATNLGISKESAHSESNTTSSSGSSQFGIVSNKNMVNVSKSRADGGKTTVEAAEAVCSVHITRQRPITAPRTKSAAPLMWPPPELSASKDSATPATYPRRMTS